MRRLFAALLLIIPVTAYGASEFPPSYRWQTITTKHFEIHFHQGEDDLVRAEGPEARVG